MITRIGGQERELRTFALTDMARYGWSDLRSVPTVRESDMRGVPAIHRAARIRAEAVASLRLYCWQGEDADREKIENVWQARLFASRPNECQTRFSFWEAIGESLAYRNQAFIWKLVDPAVNRIVQWYALHPDQVTCEGEAYRVEVRDGFMDPVGNGRATYKVDSTTILCLRGHGEGGKLEPPTPIQVFREALAGPAERQRHEGRMWRKGTSLRLAVEFPQTVSRQQAEEWRESWKSTYEGAGGETTAIIGGGAQIKPIGMTAKDADFVAMANLTVADASRIMGVPGNLLGVPAGAGVVPNLEQDLATWFRFGLGPELERIESALKDDKQLFPDLGRSIYPKFSSDMYVRGDVKTEAEVLQGLVQAGIITPDEARQIRGLGPLPKGMGNIPQITPVGGAPNPDPMPSMNGAASETQT